MTSTPAQAPDTTSDCAPETVAEAVQAVRYACAAFFATQGMAVLAWWVMLWQVPATRAWFTPPGWPASTLTAFRLPDLALLAGGSLLAGWLSLRGRPAAGAARWLVAGAMAYGTLFCLGASLETGGAWLSVGLMTPGALASLALALIGSLPADRIVRPSDPGSAARHLARTLTQIVVVWGVMLAVVPRALLEVDAAMGLPRLAWPGQGTAAVALFIAFSTLGLWAAFTFATRGDGTPLPSHSPRRLVVRGPYARVRNPMAVAGLGQGLSVALGAGSWLLLVYVAAGCLLWNYGIRPSEERDLLRRFGAPYEAYRRHVRCWIPSPRPYTGGADDAAGAAWTPGLAKSQNS
jgi:protein-S-isoprenylcysteine O-methyltransferase Ste14